MKPFSKNLSMLAGVVLLPAQAAFAGQNEPYIATLGYDHMGYGGWFFGPLMMLVFLTIIIGAIVLILKFPGVGGPAKSSRNALDLLDERFARGEIDREEYEERRSALNS